MLVINRFGSAEFIFSTIEFCHNAVDWFLCNNGRSSVLVYRASLRDTWAWILDLNETMLALNDAQYPFNIKIKIQVLLIRKN